VHSGFGSGDPSGSVGLVEERFFSVKRLGSALGKNRVRRRARVALLILLRAQGTYREESGLSSVR
jgi:hypothetical protein